MQKEEKAEFELGNAFFNPKSKIVRDLGVLAAFVYQQERGSLKILEAMAGSGIRSLRYYLESNADHIWVNEGNHELSELIGQNLRATIPPENYRLTHWDAHRLFFDCFSRRDYCDLVDVDCFGTAAPYLSTMLWATKLDGLMYLTSTDGRTLAGRIPDKSLQVYGSLPRSNPALQEQALRLLIGSVAQQAGAKGMGIQPIFSYFAGETYRLMLRLVRHPNLNSENYGFLGYCHHCGDYQTITWRKLGKVGCHCSDPNVAVSGAMWLGELHNCEYIGKMLMVAKSWGWRRVIKLLEIMQAEANLPPYFFTLKEIGTRGNLDLPPRSNLIAALCDRGYEASQTHINPEAIKTDANLSVCVEIARNCVCN